MKLQSLGLKAIQVIGKTQVASGLHPLRVFIKVEGVGLNALCLPPQLHLATEFKQIFIRAENLVGFDLGCSLVVIDWLLRYQNRCAALAPVGGSLRREG